eukprot:TRINITY_DN1203_c0_g1_i2.p1 TRINITY_DN1203_c0_g1~~TRINITY_DN1203_c0_g1_i2.p1  ORF type:complete len:253 (-),score=76.71 TRINITY_DN1203_c0_g1_i2:85-843(-)
MTSIGTGYDLSATTFSPEGRVFQTEYAQKAVDNSGTAVGLRCKDGIVLGVERMISSKMLVSGSDRRVWTLEPHMGMAIAGWQADARQMANRARDEAKNYRQFYGTQPPTRIISDRLALFVQMHTLYASVRPFGVSAIVGGYDEVNGPQLYLIDPSGLCYGYYGIAIGKGKQAAKTEVEKLKLDELTCKDALFEVAKIIHSVHDEVKDKDFELDLSWICEASGYRHQLVPADLVADAETRAKAALEEDDMEDD